MPPAHRRHLLLSPVNPASLLAPTARLSCCLDEIPGWLSLRTPGRLFAGPLGRSLSVTDNSSDSTTPAANACARSRHSLFTLLHPSKLVQEVPNLRPNACQRRSAAEPRLVLTRAPFKTLIAPLPTASLCSWVPMTPVQSRRLMWRCISISA